MEKQFRTQDLPKVFYDDGVEAYELSVAPKGEGTEFVLGIDEERQLMHLFCRGKHSVKYEIRMKNETKTADPYEGVVTINLPNFGDMYLVTTGLKDDTRDLGIDPSNRVRLKYQRDRHQVKFTFTNYNRVQRTIFHLHGYKLLLMQAIFEMIKRKLPTVTFHHQERDDLTVTTEFDRLTGNLTISHNYGHVTLEDRWVYAAKGLLENQIFYHREMTRDFRVGVKGEFSLRPDGSLFVAGQNVSKKEVSILLLGEERQVRAYPMMLWKVLS